MASILILLTIYLCSYLYQSCYLVQASYIAAFRGSRQKECSEEWINEQLDELLTGQVLSFGEEDRQIDVNLISVKVALNRNGPLPQVGESKTEAKASWRAVIRNPVAYIRAIRHGKEGTQVYE